MAKIVKGETRGRPGRWIVDYQDGAGRRRWKTCPTREAAKAQLAKALKEQPRRPQVDPTITLDGYVELWLQQIAGSVKPSTVDMYTRVYAFHLKPQLGAERVYLLDRGPLKALLASKRQTLARATVAAILAVLRAVLNAAIDDGLITSNPAAALGRTLRLGISRAARQEQIKALTAGQIEALLEAAPHVAPRYAGLYLLLARAGLRLGEGLALQWPDVDIPGRTIQVERGVSHGRVDTPKSGHGRTVAMSEELAQALAHQEIEYKKARLRTGGTAPAWVFCTDDGALHDDRAVREAFARCLKAAALPGHFTPHCLRHTFASLLLQRGESPQYVQEQLGHASITLTCDTYGRWLPKKALHGGVNGLDRAPGARHVAAGSSRAAQVRDFTQESPEFVTIP
jgi:integrase